MTLATSTHQREFLLIVQHAWKHEKLQEKAGPEARKLFEKLMSDVEKLRAQQDQKGG